MDVGDIMNRIVKVQPSSTALQIARLMEKKRTGSVFVESGGKVVGVITERDILFKVVARNLSPQTLKAGDIMTSPVITIDKDTCIMEASRIMAEKKIRRLAVASAGRIVGKITTSAISKNYKYLLTKDCTEMRNNPDFSNL
jgi:CBS domain-containing protein